MSKKLLMLCTAVLSLAFIGSSFAGVENIQVSGDIHATALTRDYSLGATENSIADSEDFIFSQVRLRFDADLTENVGAVIGLINERIWGSEDTDGEDAEIELDLGYVELKDFLDQSLSITVGRQPLRYGCGLIVGDPDTNQGTALAASETPREMSDLSLKKSFDAIRAVLDYAPYTIDIIYSRVNEGTTNVNDDVTLMGTNVAYEWDSYNGLTEGYLFIAENERITTNFSQAIESDQSRTYAVGARTKLDYNDHLTLIGEGAYQFGDHYEGSANLINAGTYGSKRKAWAGIVSAEYKFLNDYNAKLGASYTLLSGDNPSSKAYEGWDPMFEDVGGGEIINALFAASNCHLYNVNGSYMPQEDVTLGMNYCFASLYEKLPDATTVVEGNAVSYATYTPTFGPAASNIYNIRNGRMKIGHEIDTYAIYDYTEDVQLKLTGACFLPGNLFDRNNRETAYSIKGGLSVNF